MSHPLNPITPSAQPFIKSSKDDVFESIQTILSCDSGMVMMQVLENLTMSCLGTYITSKEIENATNLLDNFRKRLQNYFIVAILMNFKSLPLKTKQLNFQQYRSPLFTNFDLSIKIRSKETENQPPAEGQSRFRMLFSTLPHLDFDPEYTQLIKPRLQTTFFTDAFFSEFFAKTILDRMVPHMNSEEMMRYSLSETDIPEKYRKIVSGDVNAALMAAIHDPDLHEYLFERLPQYFATHLPEKGALIQKTALMFQLLFELMEKELNTREKTSTWGNLKIPAHRLLSLLKSTLGDAAEYFEHRFFYDRVSGLVPKFPLLVDLEKIKRDMYILVKKIGFYMLGSYYCSYSLCYSAYLEFINDLQNEPGFQKFKGAALENHIQSEFKAAGFLVAKFICVFPPSPNTPRNTKINEDRYRQMKAQTEDFTGHILEYQMPPKSTSPPSLRIDQDFQSNEKRYLEIDMIARKGNVLWVIECKATHINDWFHLPISIWIQKDTEILEKNQSKIRFFQRNFTELVRFSPVFFEGVREYKSLIIKTEGTLKDPASYVYFVDLPGYLRKISKF